MAEHLARAGSTRWRAELQDALGRFRGPVRIVTGSDDPLASVVATRLASLPNVELVSIPDAGHHPQLTHRDVLVDLLKGPVFASATE